MCKTELLIPLVPAKLFYWVFSISRLNGWSILSVAETKLLASFQIFLFSHSYQICWNSRCNTLKYSQNPILKISIATALIPSHHYYSSDYCNHLLTGFLLPSICKLFQKNSESKIQIRSHLSSAPNYLLVPLFRVKLKSQQDTTVIIRSASPSFLI